MSPRTADSVPMGGAFAVAVAAVLGGAFLPGQRLVVGGLLVLVLWWFGSQRSRISLTSAEWVLLAFVAWGTVSAVVVGMSPLVAKEVVTGWLGAWCLWVAARRASPGAAAMGAMVLMAAAVLVVGGAGLEAIGRGNLRVGGLLENPNIAAALLVAALPLAGVYWSESKRPWMILIAIMLVVGVGLTGSRAGLLAILAAGAALLPRGRARIAGLATGTAAVVTVLVWRFVSQPDILAWFRPAIWRAMLRLWASHPLAGVGPGGLADAAGPIRLLHEDHVGHHQFLATYAESTPLGLLVQTGAIGLVIVLLAAGLWLRQARHDGALAFAPLQSAVVGMAVMAAFHDFMTIEIVVWWWAVTFGLIDVGCRPIWPARERIPMRLWTRFVRGLSLVFIILWGMMQPAFARWLWYRDTVDPVLALRAVAVEPWFDEPLEWRVRVLQNETSWTWELAAEALAIGRRAVRIHPGDSGLWVALGQVNYRIINEFGSWPSSVAEARKAFKRASELEPFQPWPWLEWARLERGLGNLDESAVLVRKALAAEPHAIRARLFLARVELDRGNVRLAREALSAARMSASLRKRAGLKTYEKELLAAPMWQIREIVEALQ